MLLLGISGQRQLRFWQALLALALAACSNYPALTLFCILLYPKAPSLFSGHLIPVPAPSLHRRQLLGLFCSLGTVLSTEKAWHDMSVFQCLPPTLCPHQMQNWPVMGAPIMSTAKIVTPWNSLEEKNL